jgi:hypothetical protein
MKMTMEPRMEDRLELFIAINMQGSGKMPGIELNFSELHCVIVTATNILTQPGPYIL